MNTSQAHKALEIAARLDSVLTDFVAFLFNHMSAPFLATLSTRISRARQRIVAVLALLAAGRTPRVYTMRVRAPRAPAPDATLPTGRQASPPAPMPRGRDWLRRLLRQAPWLHNFNLRANRLDTLLHEPETLALLATAPEATLKALGRALRPLCHTLGIALPEPLRLPPRPRPHRPRKPRPKPPGAPLPTDRPLPRYVALAARAWKKKYG